MKTMKHSGKKILSVFLAVLMVMTAWVWVPGEFDYVSASGTDNAAAVSQTNLAALNSISGLNTDVTTVYGSFPHDSNDATYNTDTYRAKTYKNVLYSGNISFSLADTDTGAYRWNIVLSGNSSAICGVAYYYPTTTFMYDGETTPQTGIMMYLDSYKYKQRTYSAYMTNTASTGLSFADSYWRGRDSTALNFLWNYYSHLTNGNFATTDGSVGTNCTTGDAATDYNIANLLAFTGTMDDSVLAKTITPTFGWKGNFGSDGTGTVNTVTDFTVTSPIYIINYKPLKARINDAITIVNSLKASPAMYTTASVAEYVAAVKDLIAAKPNNYVNASKNDYNGYATAAAAAIKRYDNAIANAELATYTLKFVDIDGNVKYTQDYDYGTTVDCATLAANLPNTVKQISGNTQQHQTHIWDTTSYVSTVVDDIVITELVDKTVDHTYGDWTQNADDHTRTCSVCGYVHTQAHINGTGYITKAETCTEDGVMTYDCSVCLKTAVATSVINNITGHNFAGTAVENETGENGNHWIKCTRCDTYGWGTTANACEDHNWDKNADGAVDAADAETKASTCKEAGYEKYTCQVCSATFTKTLELVDHITTKTEAVDVRVVCGGNGNVEFWSCSVCGRYWKDSALTDEVTDTTDDDGDGIPNDLETYGPDHSFDGAYKSVSTGKDGTHNRICSICGKVYGMNGVEGATEPHSWGDPTVVEASCTKAGSKTYKCTLCSQTYTETIEITDHSMTKIDAVTPECGKAGNNEYYQCSECKNYFKDEKGTTATTVAAETLAALTHTWTAHHDYDTLKTAATCQSKAVYNNHCDYCKVQLVGATHVYGDVDTVNGHQFNGAINKNTDGTHSYKCTVAGCTEYGNATGCDYEVTEDVASTCKTLGYTTYTCTVCENGYSTQKTAYDFTNHEGGTEVKYATDAKCNTDGFTGNTYCLGCGTKTADGTAIKADPTVHPHENMQDYAKVDSTCQTEGYNAYRYCSACGTYETEKVTITKKDHKFTAYTTTGNGTHTATCDTCDATVAAPATDEQNCSGGTANCVDQAVCTVCNTAYGNVDGENHKTVVTVKKVDSTCQTEGCEAYRKCEACNVNVDTPTTIAKKEHSYGAWSSNNDDTHTRTCTTCDETIADKATETEDCSGGAANCVDKAKCSVCKSEYGTIDSTTHKSQAATLTGAYGATCTAPGYTGDKLYDCCSAIKEKGTEIAQLDHNYTIEVEDSKVASTCTVKGSVDYKCETCDATEERALELDPQNHASEETTVINEKAATCESDGYTGDTYHKCCYVEGGSASENRYALISKGSTIKANGQHVYGDAVPEYMVEEIVEVTDDDGKVTSRSLKLKSEEPAYAEKITYRRDDNYWYHVQICEECDEVLYSRCYTYPEHQSNCTDTDTCVVCTGLCSLQNPAKHKNLTLVEKVSATCTDDGCKAYYKCDACGKKFFDATATQEITAENESKLEIPATGNHTIDRDETPTQVKDEDDNVISGKHAYSCSVCDTEIVEACSGGTATCKAKAECQYCGAEYGELNRNNHVEGTTIQGYVAPDRCKPGVSGKTVYICCPDVVVYEGDIEPATEPHDWVETTDKADNCANGYTITKTCSYCGEAETTEIAAGTHDLSAVVYETEKDCKKERTIYYACSICGFTDKEVTVEGTTYKYIYAEVIAAKEDCTWTSWVYEQKANCVTEGKKTRECVACGKTEEEILPKTDHTLKTEAGTPATCDNPGKQDYVYCVIEGCPYVKGGTILYADKAGAVIEALGHGDYNGDDYCDNCGGFLQINADGTNCNCVCHKQNAFMKFMYKILSFFWKLFGISRTCCSAGTHY